MITGTTPAYPLGEFMPNHRDVLSVFGLYNEEVTLNGIESIDGGYIGIRCLAS